MRRWVKASVAAAVVMGLVGWFAEPYAQNWWLAREACGGVLPADAVEQLLLEGAQLTDEDERQVDGLGSYRCRLMAEGDPAGADDGDIEFLEFTAYTRQDDQDREYMTIFGDEGFPPVSPLPEGMPGFIDRYGDVKLLMPCPDLGTDATGRQRTLLVSTSLIWEAKREAEPQDVYEVSVALANSASKRLGCGAEPVKVPEVDPEQLSLTEVEGGPETVPLSEVGGTACGWLTKAGLPQDTEWEVAVRTNGSLPVSRCDLLAVGGGQDGGEEKLVFLGWYGDWSARLVTWQGKPRSMTATARCQGEAAHFRVSGSDEIPGVDDAAKRDLFEVFARDEVRRHDCSELRLTP